MTNSVHQDNLGLAIMLTLGGFLSLSVSDAIVKWLGTTYDFLQLLPTLQFSAVFVIFVTAFILKKQYNLIAPSGLKWQIFRGLMMPIGTMSVFYALPRVPLSSFYAVVFSAPIITSVLSIVFLKEQVLWQRWAGIFLGFVGVMIVIRPGVGDFNPALLFVLLAATLFAIGSIMIRKFSQSHSAIGYTFVVYLTSAICSLIIFLLFGKEFIVPSFYDTLLFTACGACMGLGMFFVAKGIMMAQASIIAPFHYSQMIWGILFGYVFFDNLPDRFVVIGASVVIISGLYIWHRENKMRTTGERMVVLRRMIVAIPRKSEK